MIAKYKFKQFSFGSFSGFIKELITKEGMGDIRFSHFKNKDFSIDNKQILEHMGDVNVENTFLNAWSNNLSKMRVVSFELFKKAGGLPRIEITFDIDKNIISLNKIQNISIEKVEKYLSIYFEITRINSGTNIWWKYTHPVWWIWFALVFIFKDTIWQSIKKVWNFEWVKWLVANMAVPLIVAIVAGLVVAYFIFKFKWNGQ